MTEWWNLVNLTESWNQNKLWLLYAKNGDDQILAFRTSKIKISDHFTVKRSTDNSFTYLFILPLNEF